MSSHNSRTLIHTVPAILVTQAALKASSGFHGRAPGRLLRTQIPVLLLCLLVPAASGGSSDTKFILGLVYKNQLTLTPPYSSGPR